ncbi:MAG: hypothetical protein A3A86_00750 [Elusimicrobia bacterium RIFCSPLOWO2_01_FULL_60_11]|nr:MAG: hypothetical protein A3A86_00750 [Elusimicrobia bacterium RIFCSPLOWO2_01_FULL_60_11]
MDKRAAAVLALLWLLLAVPSTVKRFRAEKKDKTVELCVSLSETRELAGDADLLNFLERCRIVGVRSLALEPDFQGALPDLGFSFALLMGSEGPFKLPAPERFPVGTYVVMPDAPDIYGQGLYFARDFENEVKTGDSRFALFDMKARSHEQALGLAKAFPRHVIKAHTVPPRETAALPRKVLISRWERAVSERGCRFLYLHWSPRWNAEENLAFLRELRGRLRLKGFEFGASAGAADAVYVELPGRPGRLVLAWLAAALTPLAALFRIKKSSQVPGGPLRVWGEALLFPVLGGLTVSFLLPDTVFSNGLEAFRGVKAALIVPLLFAGLILCDREKIKEFFESKISVRQLGLLFLALAVLWAMLERSGNFSTLVSGPETRLREALEDLLGARPRFKEFLIGHPLLILGVWLGKNVREGSRDEELSRACLWAGAVGLVSVANSFCHLHTPLSVTLLRTFHGAWLGALIGAGLVRAVQWRRRSS